MIIRKIRGLQDGQHSAGTALLLRRIRAACISVTLASTGRVTLVTWTGERRIYVLELDRSLVASNDPAVIAAADSPLSAALRDLTA